jgi:hypothetical protein
MQTTSTLKENISGEILDLIFKHEDMIFKQEDMTSKNLDLI